MKATTALHDLGHSLWLDNITRDLLINGPLRHYIDAFSIAGLTSNPSIFNHAIKNSSGYDAAIDAALAKGEAGEALFFHLAVNDHTRAADLFRPAHNCANGVDGWVSLDVSPLPKRICGASSAVNSPVSTLRSIQSIPSLPAQLQDEGAKAVVKSWAELMTVIASKRKAITTTL